MEPTNNKKTVGIVLGAIALVLILGGFYYSYRANQKSEEFNPGVESTRGGDAAIQTVDVKHQYKDGVHTYAGEINLGTPCDSVEVKAEMDTVNANKATLVFTSSHTEDVCTQVITARRFKTTIATNNKNLQVTGTLNGDPLKINIFEVPANENLDTFEINIKG